MYSISTLEDSKVGTMNASREPFWKRRLVKPVLSLLKQGITPRSLAFSLALGCAMGVFPVLGTTTMLCIALAALLRLNYAAVQLTNWLVYPLQIVLILPFVRLGEKLFGAEPFPLSVAELAAVAKDGPLKVFSMFGESILHALAGWIITAVPTMLLLYLMLEPLLRRALARSTAPADASAQTAP